MTNIIGVVILYQPDPAILSSNIASYLPHLDRLLVYDNSEPPHTSLRMVFAGPGSEKIDYTYFGRNEGISRRLNMAVEYAVGAGSSHLLMMDQDSSFPAGAFAEYVARIKADNTPNVAQYGVNCQPELTPVQEEPQRAVSLITSGTVLDLANFAGVGPFDENLFIDFVDLEFSYRATHKGYINLLFTDIILTHRIGFIKYGRSLKNFRLTPRLLHSPIRIYYIVRNGLYLLFRVRYLGTEAKADIKRSMRIIKNDILYHNRRGAVLSNFFMGVVDFLRNKMGKK